MQRGRRVAAVEPQEAGALRERAHAVLERDAQRLEARRQLRHPLEDVRLRFGRDGGLGEVDVELHRRHDALDALHAQPAVGVPLDRHERGLAAERAGLLPADGHRAPAEEGDEEVALRRVDEAAVAGALQRALVVVLRGEERLRVALVGAPDRLRARELHAVPVGRAALGDHEVVGSVALVEVRALGAERGRADVDDLRGADEALLRGRVLLQDDPREEAMAGAVVPEHVHDVLATVVVVEERGVEAARVEEHGLAPRAARVLRRDDVVRHVLVDALDAARVRVDEPEEAVRVREARRPDAARVGHAAQIELRDAAQRRRQALPVDEVARAVQLDAGEPLERGRREVEPFADAADRRIGMETGQDRINGVDHGVAGCRFGRHSIPPPLAPQADLRPGGRAW